MGKASGNLNLPQTRRPDDQWTSKLLLRLQQSSEEVLVWTPTMCGKLEQRDWGRERFEVGQPFLDS